MARENAAPLTVGGIWQGVVAVLRPDFGIFFATVAPFTVLVAMVLELFGPAPPTTMADFTPRVAIVLLLIPSIIGAIGQLALTWLLATPGGTPRAALGIGFGLLPAYLLGVLIITPVTSAGLILLVIPGLYLFGRFFLLGPVLVVERPGAVAALRRSWALTASSGWTVLLFLVLGILFVLGASILASGVGSAFGLLFTALGLQSVGGFFAALVAAAVSCVFTMASAAAGVVVYRHLAQGD